MAYLMPACTHWLESSLPVCCNEPPMESLSYFIPSFRESGIQLLDGWESLQDQGLKAGVSSRGRLAGGARGRLVSLRGAFPGGPEVPDLCGVPPETRGPRGLVDMAGPLQTLSPGSGIFLPLLPCNGCESLRLIPTPAEGSRLPRWTGSVGQCAQVLRTLTASHNTPTSQQKNLTDVLFLHAQEEENQTGFSGHILRRCSGIFVTY